MTTGRESQLEKFIVDFVLEKAMHRVRLHLDDDISVRPVNLPRTGRTNYGWTYVPRAYTLYGIRISFTLIGVFLPRDAMHSVTYAVGPSCSVRLSVRHVRQVVYSFETNKHILIFFIIGYPHHSSFP